MQLGIPKARDFFFLVRGARPSTSSPMHQLPAPCRARQRGSGTTWPPGQGLWVASLRAARNCHNHSNYQPLSIYGLLNRRSAASEKRPPYHREHGHRSGPRGAGMGARRALLPRRTWGDTLRTRFVHSALRTLGRAPAPQAHSCQLTRQPLAQTSSRRAGGRSSSSGTGLSPAVPSSTTSSPTRCSFETPGTLLLCVWLRAAMLYVAGSGPSALLI